MDAYTLACGKRCEENNTVRQERGDLVLGASSALLKNLVSQEHFPDTLLPASGHTLQPAHHRNVLHV